MAISTGTIPCANAGHGSPMDLIERLDNWGAVMRWRPNASVSREVVRGRIEKRYYAAIPDYYGHARQPWDYVPTPPPKPEHDDAQIIEHAVCALEAYPHTLLRGWYVYRLAEPTCLRLAEKAAHMGNRRTGWAAGLREAHEAVAAALTLPAVIRRERVRDRVQAMFADDA